MNHPRIFRTVIAGAAAAMLAGLAGPVQAQGTGRLQCAVVDENNKPLPDVTVTLEFMGDYNMTYTTKSDKNGQFVRGGLMPGRWRVSGKLADLTGFFVASIALGDDAKGTLMLKTGKAAAAALAASKMTADEIAKKNKQQKELEDTFNAAKAAMDAAKAAKDAGNNAEAMAKTDEALVKLQSMVELQPKCASCFANIGDAYVTKKDSANAEKAYKQAVDLDPTLVDVYVALAAMYGEQKRFDEATAMTAKANALSTSNGGGGNPTALYNQGVILWNQGKSEEAKPLFEKAIAADPKLAEAHYMLGMIFVGMDKKPDAVKELEAYLGLSPTGDNAATAKAILAQIK